MLGAMLRLAMLACVMLCFDMLGAMLCFVVLCYAMLWAYSYGHAILSMPILARWLAPAL